MGEKIKILLHGSALTARHRVAKPPNLIFSYYCYGRKKPHYKAKAGSGRMNAKLQSFLSNAGLSPALPRLEAAMAVFCQNSQLSGFGFLGFPHSLSGSNRPVHLSNYAAAWQDEYISNALYNDDAVVVDAQLGNLPIIWSRDNIHVRGKDASAVFERAASYDIRSVCAIPTRDKVGRLSIVAFASKDKLSSFEVFLKDNLASLHLAAAFLQANVERLTGESPDYAGHALTARELAVLKFSADGLQNRDIAAKMQITDRTVTFHIDNAMHKLDANNRAHAVARAIRFRLI
jgi:LuxR family transcriptional regulator, activator of conjugal transfer of Ti plasmids